MEFKSFPVEGAKVLDEGQGIVEAYVSVFNNVDSGKDRVLPGFFADSLATKLPKGVLYHDWNRPFSKALVAEEHEPGHPRLPEKLAGLGGLYIQFQCNLETQDGKEGFSNIRGGYLDEYSFGYDAKVWKIDETTGVRDLVKGFIYEFSPVLWGMNSMTLTVGAKGLLGRGSAAGLRMDDHSTMVRAAIEEYTERLDGLLTMRAKVGRTLSADSEKDIDAAIESITAALDRLKDLRKRATRDGDDEGKINEHFRASAGAVRLLGV